MRSMMDRLEEYLDGKGMELNPSKTKIVRFRKGREKETRKEWR